jgi:hydroxylamine dehydrogenase
MKKNDVSPFLCLLSIAFMGVLVQGAAAATCVECHSNATPGIVTDWKLSKHGAIGLDCATCHGKEHNSADDVTKAAIPKPETCAPCHAERVKQYKAGKHALAWAAMEAMPTIHWQPMIMIEGMKGCGGCHKIGVKTEADIQTIKKNSPGFGTASCDACHTRHTFSVEEARQPQACQTCHMGFDHAQWEMYSASKHGVRFLLKQNKVLPNTASAPTCQTCHMQEGNHEVRTAWGFLGVSFPMPDDKKWEEDRAVILQALHILGSDRNTTSRLLVVQGAQMARLNKEEWQKERDRTLTACSQCHSKSFAVGELEKGDHMIREADRVMAGAIRIVAALYKEDILKKPESYEFSFPDLLTFHDAPTPIEQKLFVMFFEHRMRAFQGTFHGNPDYALWYGWSELQRDLTEIKFMGDALRRDHQAKTQAANGK